MKRWGVSFILLCVIALVAFALWRQCRGDSVAQRGKAARPLPHAAIAKALADDGAITAAANGSHAVSARGDLVLQGVVVDGDGAPVGDAVVTNAGSVSAMSEIRTETDGWFAAAGLAAGGYLLTAQAQLDDGARLVGYVYYQLGTATEPAVIVVRPGVAVTVDVRHRGEPVVGAEVAIEGVIAARGVSDAAGRVVFNGMVPGAVRVWATAEGLAQAARYAHVPRSGARVQLDMIAATQLRGVVSDESGAAIAGAQIALARPDLTFTTGADVSVAVTDANGEFSARVVAGDAVRLVATHPDFLRGFSEPIIAGGEASSTSALPAPVRITLARGATLRGRVVDAAGVGVAARVTLFEEPPNEVMRRERHAQASADGRFAFATVQAGAVSLQAATEAARSELWSAEAVPSAEVALVVAHALAIDGIVVSRGGLPVAGAHVTAYREESSDLDYGGELAAVADADGRFRLQGASADAYRLVACHAEADVDLGSAAGAVTAKGGASGVVLTYDDLAEVVGTVAGAAPGEEVVVQLCNRSVVAKAGAFVVRDVSPGRCGLQVRIGNVQVAFRPGVEVAPPRVEVGEVVLAPVLAVRGVVVDAAGRPVGGALVSAGFAGWLATQSLATLINDSTLLQTWSRADGGFELALRAGEGLALRADAAAMRSATVAWSGQSEVRLTMAATGGAMGRVVDASGRGIARAVEVATAQGDVVATSRSGDDGAFAFAALPAGRYLLSVDGDEGGAAVVVVPAGSVVRGILVKALP